VDLLSSLGGDRAIDFAVSMFIRGTLLSLVLVAVGAGFRRVSSALRAAWWTTGALAVVSVPMISTLIPGWGVGPFSYPLTPLWRPIAGGATAAGVNWGAVVIAIWAIGAIGLAARTAVQVGRVAWLTQRAGAVERGPLGSLIRSVRVRLGLPRRVRVVLSETVEVPFTWGLRSPVVVLPESSRSWPPELQRAVLHHEFAHVARSDYLGLVWLELARTLYWPNPAVWIVHREGRREQERACDDAALRAGIPPLEYARHLVEIGRRALGRAAVAAALPMMRGDSLRDRVASVMTPGRGRRPVTAGRLLATGAMIALVSLPFALASPIWICDPAPGATLMTGPSGAAPGSTTGVPAGLSPGPITPALTI